MFTAYRSSFAYAASVHYLIDTPTGTGVTFADVVGETLGLLRKYADESKLYDILKVASWA